ncbi:Tex family protein [Alkaliflexus imshenetskii]|uniref:Tex family protein n=1 Tax=Alkaliflexus imshenetskii TaxID=286730 RepID=UPI00047C9FA5|nr:Tex family protein [Alkaliflexus imshenetskii]
MQNYALLISTELNISLKQVVNTISLLDEGATIPFISRYRKEMTGSLDEVEIGNIKERYAKLQDIQKRRETILSTIEEQGLLTDELRKKIEGTWDANELEDLYLPYKPKRKTRAVKAKERGLEPLADIIMLQQERDVENRAVAFLTDEVPNVEEALQGARDIIAERVNEDLKAREVTRILFERQAVISSKLVKGKEEEAAKYRDYFDFSEPIKRCPSHRLLAMRRGEKEGFLKVSVSPDADEAVERLERLFVKGRNAAAEQVEMAVEDAYKRLLAPSIENEVGSAVREKAESEAIRVFAANLRQLLLSPPLGQKRVLAIDPGFRTGCKVVCIDAQGNLLHNETIYPHPPQNDTKQAYKKIDSLVEAYKIEAIAIGNGTASRETESFIRNIRFNRDLQVFVVSEDGASVYSASKTARDEFPDYDVTVRGAVSIGRRLMDPLAELVKIDPKSIGVGQYQHDVDQNNLKSSLDQVVESCVNLVGVELNTASQHLLTYVSGLGPQLAKNIVEFRAENGPFSSRKALTKVPRLGAKAFEQCAGFLRISGAKNPLDNSAVHPESYPIVEQMAKDLNCSVSDLINDKALRQRIDLKKYVTDKVGMPTLTDIISELEKPGRDPRRIIKVFEFSPDVRTIEDLRQGMVLPGIVTNITNFGAFVDVGVKQDGLVHISQLADRYVSDPNEVVSLHQHVQVKVLEVDVARKRVQLTMKLA